MEHRLAHLRLGEGDPRQGRAGRGGGGGGHPQGFGRPGLSVERRGSLQRPALKPFDLRNVNPSPSLAPVLLLKDGWDPHGRFLVRSFHISHSERKRSESRCPELSETVLLSIFPFGGKHISGSPTTLNGSLNPRGGSAHLHCQEPPFESKRTDLPKKKCKCRVAPTCTCFPIVENHVCAAPPCSLWLT